MTGKTARLIFWLGTLSSAAIFLWMTYDFHLQTPKFTHTDKLTDQVVAGKKVWHKYNCNDCHTILGFGGYYAPDMTKAFYRLGENNIASIVRHPEVIYRNSFRKMPQLGITEPETKQLVTFLRWVGEIENRKWPPQDEKFVEAYKLRESQPQKLEKVRRMPQLRTPGTQRGRGLRGDRQPHRLRPADLGRLHHQPPIGASRDNHAAAGRQHADGRRYCGLPDQP